MYSASVIRNLTAFAISRGLPDFLRAILDNISFFLLDLFSSDTAHMIAPGETPLTLMLGASSFANDFVTVSYTHLRAHET